MRATVLILAMLFPWVCYAQNVPGQPLPIQNNDPATLAAKERAKAIFEANVDMRRQQFSQQLVTPQEDPRAEHNRQSLLQVKSLLDGRHRIDGAGQ